MLDWVWPWICTVVCIIAILIPTEREREDAEMARELQRMNELEKERELEAIETICYDALRHLSDEEFDRVPEELKLKVPDKCSFCHWMLICDPLEMALATGKPCGGFKERRSRNASSIKDSEKIL